MFAFLGKLMGQAMRGSHLMNIDLCSAVWKALVYQPLDSSDLRAIDSAMYLQLEAVRNPPADLSPSDFDREMVQQQQLWSVVNAKGDVVALPGYEDRFTAKQTVRWAERGEWADAARRFRLHESDSQIAALRSGMGAVVPIALLPLFSWKELELQVTGRCVVSVASYASIHCARSLSSPRAPLRCSPPPPSQPPPDTLESTVFLHLFPGVVASSILSS
jgi:hypothetical protein